MVSEVEGGSEPTWSRPIESEELVPSHLSCSGHQHGGMKMDSRAVKPSVIRWVGKVLLHLVVAVLLFTLLASIAWAETRQKVLVFYDENTDFPGLAMEPESGI